MQSCEFVKLITNRIRRRIDPVFVMTIQASGKNSTERAVNALPAPEEKAGYVQAMFDAIAPRYDLLNSVLSVRMHHGWRRVAADKAQLKSGGVALDICTGTGDLALELARRAGAKGLVIGSDFSAPMLQLGEKKKAQRSVPALEFVLADALKLPFPENAFDAVTVAFGIRNVADVEAGIREMARVTIPDGKVVILEFNSPRNPVFAALYQWYSFNVLPRLGGLISGRRAAYNYLPSSVKAFYSREEIKEMMERAGLKNVTITDLTFGSVVVHRGVKSK
jgi:demethylmenaquinone methyltransferase/2-methoxy-6-polyprenyl-1,4-benzoquinol methylase